MPDAIDVLMQATLNKLSVRSEAPVAAPGKTTKSAEQNHEPPYCEDVVGHLARRYQGAGKAAKREVLKDAMAELEDNRGRQVDIRAVEGRRKVAAYAFQHTSREASEKFGIPKKTIDRWRREWPELRSQLQGK